MRVVADDRDIARCLASFNLGLMPKYIISSPRLYTKEGKFHRSIQGVSPVLVIQDTSSYNT